MEYQEVYGLPTNLVLNVTDACDLACRYCFVQQHPHYMELDTAKQAVEWLMGNYYRKKEINHGEDYGNRPVLSFFGGEPTLMWDQIMVPLTEWVKKKYPEIQLTVTTNGTLLDKDRVKFLHKNGIYPLLSIDGNANIQNINRPYRDGRGSSKDIEAVIPYLLSAFPQVTFRATVTQDTCNNIFNDSFIYAVDQGFKNIFLCPNARETWTEENISKLHKEIVKVSLYRILSFDCNERPIGMSQYDRIHQHILMAHAREKRGQIFQTKLRRPVVRCGLGTGSISVSFDGKLFGCQEQDSRDTSADFYIGDVFNGIDKEKHLKLLEEYNRYAEIMSEEEDRCEGCEMREFCVTTTCPSVSHDMFNDLLLRPRINCLFDSWIYDGCLMAMDYLSKQNNSLFKEYLMDVLMEKG